MRDGGTLGIITDDISILPYSNSRLAASELPTPNRLIVGIPFALLAINLLMWIWTRSVIAAQVASPGAMPLPTMDHPSVTEFWMIWMPGIVSWGLMAVAIVGFVILAGPMHYSLQKVPLGWYYLLSMPSFGLTAALVLADLYYFVVWS